jgi:hypothetical protein
LGKSVVDLGLGLFKVRVARAGQGNSGNEIAKEISDE